MIEVSFFKRDGRTVKVKCVGHSGLAQSGQDLLCAAVSTLIQTAYIALNDISSGLGYKRKDGFFEFDVPSGEAAHDADVIVRAMYLGLKDLQSGFPQNLKLEEA